MPVDGLCLLNCRRGSDAERALIFFNHMQPGGNDFQTPDAVVDIGITCSDGNLDIWETATTQCA
jgi:hypothetical protein